MVKIRVSQRLALRSADRLRAFLKSASASAAFCRFSIGSSVFSSCEYPAHLTSYMTTPLTLTWSTIDSTSKEEDGWLRKDEEEEEEEEEERSPVTQKKRGRHRLFLASSERAVSEVKDPCSIDAALFLHCTLRCKASTRNPLRARLRLRQWRRRRRKFRVRRRTMWKARKGAAP